MPNQDPTTRPHAAALSNRVIFLFWAPLAAQWLMMASEGPFLAAIIARTGDPAFNLAAYGVAYAFAFLVESPVIMLMSAATALVEDAASYRKLRNFAHALNAGSTALLLLVLVPPVNAFMMGTLLGLPPEVTDLVYGALWLLLPWPAAIGYRRFLHGVLIRSGRTRLVAVGTVLRILGMGTAALVLFMATELPGAWVGTAALSAGVVTEAIVAHLMARGAVRELHVREATEAALRIREAPATPDAFAVGRDTAGAAALQEGTTSQSAGVTPDSPSYRDIGRFYLPLALTSFLGLTIHPLITFFMGRSPDPVESLAVFPVVGGLVFLFRSFGLSKQEVVIALSGRRFENIAVLARFGVGIALASSGALALVAFTPLAGFWFESLSGLTPELAALAYVPARVAAVLPAVAVLLAFQHAVIVRGRKTRPITVATAIEVTTIALLFGTLGWGVGLTGATAAMAALVGGRLCGNLFLADKVRATLRRVSAAG